MRRLTILVIAAACLYSLYWFVGANRIEARANAAITQMQSDGWTVSRDGLSTRGYPSRFDTTITELDVTSADGALSYNAPFVQAFALSYRPTNVILAMADRQQIRFGDQVIDIASDQMRASASVSASPSVPLKEATAEASMVALSSNFGWGLNAETVILALRPTQDAPLNYDLYLGAAKLVPDGGAAIADVVFDAIIQLDQPLDRRLLADVSPAIEAIDVKALSMSWGSVRLTGSGSLTVDGAGVPYGSLDFTATQWRELVPMLTASGLISPQFQMMTLAILQNLANADGSLSMPLSFEGGMMQLGSIPLGPAPRLR